LHSIEPFYNWRHQYISSEDERSPFFGNDYSEFEFRNSIYNYLIHPQWDEFGSATLYAKILYTSYQQGFTIIELFGEWNDCIYNDIKFLKENIADVQMSHGIDKFILIGENVMNFHASDDCYYQEWFEEISEGWIACVNFRPHVIKEFERANIEYYLAFGDKLNNIFWRKLSAVQLFRIVAEQLTKQLNP
jgi:hypothetical protein